MRKLNLIILVLVALFGVSSAAMAQYTVSLAVTDWWWSSEESFKVWESATIMENGNPIPNRTQITTTLGTPTSLRTVDTSLSEAVLAQILLLQMRHQNM